MLNVPSRGKRLRFSKVEIEPLQCESEQPMPTVTFGENLPEVERSQFDGIGQILADTVVGGFGPSAE